MSDASPGKRPVASETEVVLVPLTQDELAEATRLLSKLSTHDDTMRRQAEPRSEKIPTRSVTFLQRRAREILNNRRRRLEIFGRAMFSEPAWEMLLALYLLEGQSRQTVRRLADITDISKSTALRWIEYLHAHGLVTKEPHPADKRSAFVELTEKGRNAIELYLTGTTAAPD